MALWQSAAHPAVEAWHRVPLRAGVASVLLAVLGAGLAVALRARAPARWRHAAGQAGLGVAAVALLAALGFGLVGVVTEARARDRLEGWHALVTTEMRRQPYLGPRYRLEVVERLDARARASLAGSALATGLALLGVLVWSQARGGGGAVDGSVRALADDPGVDLLGDDG